MLAGLPENIFPERKVAPSKTYFRTYELTLNALGNKV
jgi:hypothetical protein